MSRLNFVPIRSDPRIIFLSGNRPLKTTNEFNPEVIQIMSLRFLKWLIQWENIIVGTTIVPRKRLPFEVKR